MKSIPRTSHGRLDRHTDSQTDATCWTFQTVSISHISCTSNISSDSILVGVQADVTHENWVGVLQQIDISGGGNPESFLPKAVSFANDKCWGTLSCALIVDLVTQKTNATAVDTAIADLRYGSVNVNLPTILGYAVTKMAWGGFPGSTPQVMLWQAR